jgi:hypothetical protein
VQVCDLHRRLKDVDIEDFRTMMTASQPHPGAQRAPTPPPASAFLNGGAPLQRTHSAGEAAPEAPPHGVPPSKSAGALQGLSPSASAAADSAAQPTNQERFAAEARRRQAAAAAAAGEEHPAVDHRQRRLDRLYDAAVVADRNAKLSIFATRPAIYSPVRCPNTSALSVRGVDIVWDVGAAVCV